MFSLERHRIVKYFCLWSEKSFHWQAGGILFVFARVCLVVLLGLLVCFFDLMIFIACLNKATYISVYSLKFGLVAESSEG